MARHGKFWGARSTPGVAPSQTKFGTLVNPPSLDPTKREKVKGGIFLGGEGPPTPKKFWGPKTRFFDRTLQKNENWKKKFFGGGGPTPSPTPPPKIEIDPLSRS